MGKIFGSILLIVGTSLGAGMLALPVATAPGGFAPAIILLVTCWLVMTMGALLIMEVSLWLPPQNNLISMAGITLGKTGQVVTWFTYLALLYCLVAAYISSGTDDLNHLLSLANITTPMWVDSLIFVLIFGFVVYRGIRSVDYVNRIFMLIKFSAYFLLIMFILPHLKLLNLAGAQPHYLLSVVTVAITSFGYASIIPTLRTYLDGDAQKLRIAVLVGSLIPLICYGLWVAAIMGTIPLYGEHGLVLMLKSGRTTSALNEAVRFYLHQSLTTLLSNVFTNVCVITSFLGVSISLNDFWADGLRLKKSAWQQLIVLSLTFIPPLAITILYPNLFIKGLSYAGIFCMILLVLLPALMVWQGRYRKSIAHGYRLWGGKFSLVFVMIIAVVIVGLSVIEDLHWISLTN